MSGDQNRNAMPDRAARLISASIITVAGGVMMMADRLSPAFGAGCFLALMGFFAWMAAWFGRRYE